MEFLDGFDDFDDKANEGSAAIVHVDDASAPEVKESFGMQVVRPTSGQVLKKYKKQRNEPCNWRRH